MTLYLCGLMISFFVCYQLNFIHDQTEPAKIARAIITAFTWPLLLTMVIAFVAVVYIALLLDKASNLLASVIDEFV